MLPLTLYLAIHGDKQQNERDWVLNEFKTGKSPIMVATDVASRGIGMMIQYPLPPCLHLGCIYLRLPVVSCDMVRSSSLVVLDAQLSWLRVSAVLPLRTLDPCLQFAKTSALTSILCRTHEQNAEASLIGRSCKSRSSQDRRHLPLTDVKLIDGRKFEDQRVMHLGITRPHLVPSKISVSTYGSITNS
jgi:hypothetical protein